MLTYQINSRKNETRYLFIDGGYLDKVLKKVGLEFWDTDNLEIDYSKLGSNYNKVFYYNCLPEREMERMTMTFKNGLKQERNSITI